MSTSAGDSSTSGQEEQINITVKGPSELKLTISISPKKSVGELKDEIASKSDVEKGRQRLIYSGKVLKDEDPISNYKIQTGHTIHMVKGSVKAPEAPAAAPPLPQMGTGLNVGRNPVDSIENIQHGLAGFNPFQGMGMNNLTDPNAMTGMMDNPEFLRSMSEMMSRPEIVEQIIASQPHLAHMAPQIRSMMSNPMMRQIMSNPETLRAMMQMQGGMGGGMPGMGGGAGAGGGNDFANLFAQNAGAGAGAGGATTENPTPGAGAGAGAGAQGANAGQTPFNPFAAMLGGGGGAGGQGANPFAAMLGAGGAGGQGAGAGAGAGGMGGFNPFMFGAPGGGAGGFGSPAPPQDTRPAEEIYATQLGQLNGMGLWDAAKNIRALRRTGGNVEAAIELIFSGQVEQ